MSYFILTTIYLTISFETPLAIVSSAGIFETSKECAYVKELRQEINKHEVLKEQFICLKVKS